MSAESTEECTSKQLATSVEKSCSVAPPKVSFGFTSITSTSVKAEGKTSTPFGQVSSKAKDEKMSAKAKDEKSKKSNPIFGFTSMTSTSVKAEGETSTPFGQVSSKAKDEKMSAKDEKSKKSNPIFGFTSMTSTSVKAEGKTSTPFGQVSSKAKDEKVSAKAKDEKSKKSNPIFGFTSITSTSVKAEGETSTPFGQVSSKAKDEKVSAKAKDEKSKKSNPIFGFNFMPPETESPASFSKVISSTTISKPVSIDKKIDRHIPILCGFPNSNAVQSTRDTQLGFGIPLSKANAKNTVGMKPLSELFKPLPGSWECKDCYVRNACTTNFCVCCGSSNQSTSQSALCYGSSNPNASQSAQDSQLGFRIPLKSNSKNAQVSKSFSELSNRLPESWECKDCYTVNACTANFCLGCRLSNPNANQGALDSRKPSSFKFNSLPFEGVKFNFGIKSSNPGVTTYSFRTPANTNSTFAVSTVSNVPNLYFGSKPSPSTSTGNNFTFGSPRAFSFSISNVTVKSPTSSGEQTGKDGSSDKVTHNVYFQPLIPLPDEVPVVTGEEDEDVLYCHYAKLFRYRNKEWKDRGTGNVKLLRHKSTGKLRLLMRRDTVLKICLNHLLTPQITMIQKGEKSWLWAAPDFSDEQIVNEIFVIRFKYSDIAKEFYDAVITAQALLKEKSTIQLPKTSEKQESILKTAQESGCSESKMGDNMEVIKVKKEFYSIAECPVCSKYMNAPIVMCATGHNICNECKNKHEKCPSCNEVFISVRNFSLEKMVENMQFPCKNTQFGCKDKMFLCDATEHDQICPYRLYDCLVGKGECTWKGRKHDILIHVEQDHKNCIVFNKESNDIADSITEYTSSEKDCNLISADGEIFWLQKLVKPTEKTYYISVHYIGASENCLKYLYKLHFVSDSIHEVRFTTQTHPDHITIEDIVEKEIGCFSIKNCIAKHFTVNDAVHYILEITKAP